MSNKVLSVEIGQNMTRVVEVDYKTKKPKIYSAFSFETPVMLVEDGVIGDNPVFVEEFKNQLAGQMINTNKVIYTISSSRIATREVTLPLVKEKQIASMIEANASEYFPVDLSEYKLVHNIVEKIDTPEQKEYKLAVMAIPVDMIRSYMALASACGLTVEGFDYIGNSVLQVMKRHFAEGVNAFLKIESNNTLITLIKDGKIELQRSVPYGIAEAVEALTSSKAYGTIETYMDAVDLFTRKTCIRRYLNPDEIDKDEEEENKNESADIIKTKAEITEEFRALVSNLNRNLSYYLSNHKDEKIETIKLVGVGADFSGLSKLLTNELGHKVTVLTQSELIDLSKEMETEGFNVCRYIACVGATLDPVLDKKDLSEKEGAKSKAEGGSLKLAAVVFGVCMLASVLMLAYGIISGIVIKNTHEKLAAEKTSLQPAQDAFDNFTEVQGQYNELKNLYASTESPNEEMRAFIEELEAKMPSSINVISLSADNAGVNMSITVADKPTAADVLVQLRSFDSLADVTTSGITENTDETGASSVSMDLVCTYEGQETTEADGTETENAESTNTDAE